MAGFIRKGLSDLGYGVDVAETAGAAQAMASAADYDLVILDVMLPDRSGIDLARSFRSEKYEGPILMLTALSGTQNKVDGLDAGADDYLVKPFEFDELTARVRALLRRGSSPQVGSRLCFADLEMDLLQRKVTRAGKPISLTSKEFSLLEYFLRNSERVLSRALISEHVWDARFDSDSNVIDVYVNLLRKKVDQPFPSKLLHTVVGMGYVLKRPE